MGSIKKNFDLMNSRMSMSDFLEDLHATNDVSEKVMKVNNYVGELENELSKIDPFKRELPLSMLLLNDGKYMRVCVFWYHLY